MCRVCYNNLLDRSPHEIKKIVLLCPILILQFSKILFIITQIGIIKFQNYFGITLISYYFYNDLNLSNYFSHKLFIFQQQQNIAHFFANSYSFTIASEMLFNFLFAHHFKFIFYPSQCH